MLFVKRMFNQTRFVSLCLSFYSALFMDQTASFFFTTEVYPDNHKFKSLQLHLHTHRLETWSSYTTVQIHIRRDGEDTLRKKFHCSLSGIQTRDLLHQRQMLQTTRPPWCPLFKFVVFTLFLLLLLCSLFSFPIWHRIAFLLYVCCYILLLLLLSYFFLSSLCHHLIGLDQHSIGPSLWTHMTS